MPSQQFSLPSATPIQLPYDIGFSAVKVFATNGIDHSPIRELALYRAVIECTEAPRCAPHRPDIIRSSHL